MILWFAVLAPVIVAEVFKSPMVDYRVVALGALLPVAEVLVGGPRLLHTLLGATVVMAVVMVATQGRRLVRRRWLGIPIGLGLHLVLDGTWTEAALLWWPAFGSDFAAELPELARWRFSLFLELVAVAVGFWAARRYRLDEPSNRELLVRRGQLVRGVL